MNTLIKFCTGVASVLKATDPFSSRVALQTNKSFNSSIDHLRWATVKTTSLRWEAELMEQVLAAHEVPARIIDLGIESYMGQGSLAALQVHAEDEQFAIQLLSVINEATEASE
ncbi:hypothetical protein [Stenomitos frigidus]|uniref:hypothetical protein n=1 Tax=Stenomitos frigidus TaxID=1886765 RepID=UPI0011B23730|nr:hypothetical protein [Stenomitos frigidus]